MPRHTIPLLTEKANQPNGLVRSASFILLQGVPTSVSLEAVHAAISRIPGVLSVHELHIWQLSETKIVASVHVLVKKSHKPQSDKKDNGSTSKSPIVAPGRPDDYHGDLNEEYVYMTVASDIRRVLHDYGIHSSTIQPEYVMDGTIDEAVSFPPTGPPVAVSYDMLLICQSSIRSGCLIPCMTDAECDPANACCREWLLLSAFTTFNS